MSFEIDHLANFLQSQTLIHWLRALALLLFGIILLRVLSRLVVRLTKHQLSPQAGMLLGKAIGYSGACILVLAAMHELGFRLGTILGAAGVVGVALGFAAQTSLSNLISGLFLIAESSFKVGDVITVNETTGVVDSIDLLSVKLRTFDNKYVRMPNESLIKGKVTNITYFPIRRVDINIRVGYAEDIGHVLEMLKEIAEANLHVLNEPEPLILFNEFADSHLNILLGLWIAHDQWLDLNRTIRREIKERFEAEGIEVPFPQRIIHLRGDGDPDPLPRKGFIS